MSDSLLFVDWKNYIRFSGARLLSKSESEALISKEEKECTDSWWTTTPADTNERVYCVNKKGDTCDAYINEYLLLRPALVISDIGTYKVGDIIYIDSTEYKIISKSLAWMCNENIGLSTFGSTTDYETSAVKKHTDNWYRTIKKRYLDNLANDPYAADSSFSVKNPTPVNNPFISEEAFVDAIMAIQETEELLTQFGCAMDSICNENPVITLGNSLIEWFINYLPSFFQYPKYSDVIFDWVYPNGSLRIHNADEIKEFYHHLCGNLGG